MISKIRNMAFTNSNNGWSRISMINRYHILIMDITNFIAISKHSGKHGKWLKKNHAWKNCGIWKIMKYRGKSVKFKFEMPSLCSPWEIHFSFFVRAIQIFFSWLRIQWLLQISCLLLSFIQHYMAKHRKADFLNGHGNLTLIMELSWKSLNFISAGTLGKSKKWYP